MDDKTIDSLIDSLVESIKKFRKNIGQPTLGDDLISDASKKSTLARSTKDFLAESMCIAIKLYRKNCTFRNDNDEIQDKFITNSTFWLSIFNQEEIKCKYSKIIVSQKNRNYDSHDSSFEEMIRLDTLGICIVQQGVYRIRLNKKEYTLKEGEILMANTNDFYDNVSFSKDFEGLVVFASVDMSSKLVEDTHLYQYIEK